MTRQLVLFIHADVIDVHLYRCAILGQSGDRFEQRGADNIRILLGVRHIREKSSD